MTATPSSKDLENQLKILAQGLLDKTRAGRVNWVRTEDSAYQVILPQSKIRIWYTRPRVEPDSISLGFFNSRGMMVGALTADKPELTEVEKDPNWPLLECLYMEIHRQVTGWDKVLGEVRSALEESGTIGQASLRGTLADLGGTMASSLERSL